MEHEMGGVHREGTAFCSLGGAISGGSKFFFLSLAYLSSL